MTQVFTTIITLSLIVFFGFVLASPQPQITISKIPATANATSQKLLNNVTNFTNKLIETPSLEKSKKPPYIPTLRQYRINKDSELWHAQDPSSYITPDNEWVRYYANRTNEVQVQYLQDKDNTNYPLSDTTFRDYNGNFDYWQNADFTLYTMIGDCEDESIVWVSIYRALGYKAMVIAGELWFDDGSSNNRDYWVEWAGKDGVKNVKFIAPITKIKSFRPVPLYMFNDKIKWSKYNENWYRGKV